MFRGRKILPGFLDLVFVKPRGMSKAAGECCVLGFCSIEEGSAQSLRVDFPKNLRACAVCNWICWRGLV